MAEQPQPNLQAHSEGGSCGDVAEQITNVSKGLDFLAQDKATEVRQDGNTVAHKERWSVSTAEAYEHLNLANHPVVFETLANYLLPFSTSRDVVDLGCADGTLGTYLQARSLANVDPYPPKSAPPERDIIPMDGVEYLNSRDPASFDLVVSAFAVHFMERVQLDAALARSLRQGGRACYFSVSTTSPLFDSADFNDLFFSYGFERSGSSENRERPVETLAAQRPWTSEQMKSFVRNRTWSNLAIMPPDAIDRLLALVPEQLSSVTLHIDVYENVF